MNKRIQELAEQAENDYRASVLGASMYKTPPDILMKKFAELIVRECIRIGQETSKDIFKMSKKEGDIFEYESHGAEQVVDNIKEHFGIE